MAPKTKAVPKAAPVKENCSCELQKEEFSGKIEELLERIGKLEVTIMELTQRRTGRSIQKIEEFNGEELPPVEGNSRMKLAYEDKLYSMSNAAKILPPNLMVEGKHTCDNIQALVGFSVDEQMLEEMYDRYPVTEI